ncbi:MAG: radical SAM protein [Clostridia bacterium]|nr:radical SAM protein [Clostridia bacterium]
MKHHNLPVFVPFYGCPHRCVFCDQRSITGQADVWDADLVRQELERYAASVPEGDEAEIAFFGGTFTGIPRKAQQAYLDIAASFVRDGRAKGIRFSTRPDCLDGDTVDFLKGYPLSCVELGIQSLSDRVLQKIRRGHDAACAMDAMERLRKAGIPFAGQMMTGLPGSTPEDETETAQGIIRAGACEARIYPLVVFAGTDLERMCREGDYTPPGQQEMLRRTAAVLELFRQAGVKVLRIGLCENESLRNPGVAVDGAKESALGERVWSLVYQKRVEAEMARRGPVTGPGQWVIEVPRGAESKVSGQKKENRMRWESAYPGVRVRIRGLYPPDSDRLTVRFEAEQKKQ